jgi:hypothetical protein
VFVFATNAVLSGGFNNASVVNQIYRYEPGASHELTCISCAPVGTVQSPASSVIRGRSFAGAGSRIFFSTTEKLVPADENGVEDVYEWEQEGTGSCAKGQVSGCFYLISSGKSPDPSFYLDNSESGNDVFFSTREGLVPSDTDGAYDVYDARVGGGFPPEPSSTSCESGCQGTPGSPPILGAPAGSALYPAGENVPPGTPRTAVQTFTNKTKPKLTRKQLLAKALKACRSKPKKQRPACVKRANKAYGAKVKAKAKAKSRRRARR